MTTTLAEPTVPGPLPVARSRPNLNEREQLTEDLTLLFTALPHAGCAHWLGFCVHANAAPMDADRHWDPLRLARAVAERRTRARWFPGVEAEFDKPQPALFKSEVAS